MSGGSQYVRMILPTPDIRESRVCIFITAHGSDGFRKFPARSMCNGHPTEATRMNTGYGVFISIVAQCRGVGHRDRGDLPLDVSPPPIPLLGSLPVKRMRRPVRHSYSLKGVVQE